jgi:flavin reductase (DIM6/NTAB) family NADH-FMN oxidoreductase RutF
MTILDPEHFKEIMRHWAAGVTVVTSRWGEQIHGATVNSFTSVSLTPPLVSVSFAKTSHTYQLIHQAKIFAVNILGEQQRVISERFAGRPVDVADRFQNESHHPAVTGAPILDCAIAFADCQAMHEFDLGTNVILVGLVVAGRVLNEAKPLVYSNRQYWQLTHESK